jgi:hypothetical protein
MEPFKTTHSNYRRVLNSEEPLYHYNIEDYIARENPEHPEHKNLNYHSEYTGYRGVVWTPLDLPFLEIDLDHVWNVWQEVRHEKREGLAQPWFDERPDDMNSSRHSAYSDHDYRGFLLFKNTDYYNMDTPGEWYDIVQQEFPQVKEFCEALPFDNIRFIAFAGRDDHGVGPHYDEDPANRARLAPQEPSQIRIRWSNVTTPEKEHLYFTKDHGATRIYPILPADTNTMAWDGQVHEHGADRGFHPKDRLILMPMGTLNIKKWHELLERSINKYKDYVITVDHLK